MERKHLLNNARFQTQILMVLGLPVLGLLWMGLTQFMADMHTFREMDRLSYFAVFATRTGGLIHHLQRERGASAVVLGSRGDSGRDGLMDQRKLTDQALQDWVQFTSTLDKSGLSDDFSQQLQQAENKFGRMKKMREAIGSAQINALESNAFFTETIAGLLDVLSLVSGVASDVDIKKRALSYVEYLKSKEKAGQERAVGSANIALGYFGTEQHQMFQRIVVEQEVYLSLAGQYMAPELLGLQERIVTGRDVDEVLRIRDLVFSGGLAGDLEDTTAPYWYKVTTSRIDLMKQVEDRIAENLLDKAADLHREARNSLIWDTALVAVPSMVAIWLAVVVSRFISNRLAMVMKAADRLADGNLTVAMAAGGRNEIGRLQNAMAALIGKLSGAMGEVSAATGALAAAAEQTSAVSVQTSQGIHQQQQDITLASTAMHQMATSIREVSGNTQQAAELSNSVDSLVRSGIEELNETVSLITELARQAETTAEAVALLKEDCASIHTVLEVISGIAEQTNLLALNAAIEAARAGEQGSGFAVVADEVRILARRTQDSTNDIQVMIEKLQHGSEHAAASMRLNLEQSLQGMEKVRAVDQRLHSIVEGVADINQMNTQIASAVEEQSTVVEEINRNIVRISDTATQTSAGAEEGSATSHELARLAENLRRQVSLFKIA